MREPRDGRWQSCRLNTLQCYTATRPICSNNELLSEPLWHGEHDHDGRKDHEVGIQEDEHACVVEAPLTPQAAGGLRHAPCCNQQSENLPVRAVHVFDAGKAGEAQAGGKCAHRKEDGAHQRPLPQAKDREEVMHNPSMYRGGAKALLRDWT